MSKRLLNHCQGFLEKYCSCQNKHRVPLWGRVAVVTGGNKGIGFEVAHQLALGGAKISLWARDAEALQAAAQRLSKITDVQTEKVDVGEETQVQAAAANLMERFGKVDILVNNAGILGPRLPVGEYPAKDFERVMRINQMGTFHCCSALVPYMKRDAMAGLSTWRQ